MRNYVLQWRRGAMSFVLAAACASGLSTSGCNRSSSRDVSIDLSKQGAESALETERKIALRNRNLDLAEEQARSEEVAGKVSLPSTKPDVSANPLAQLLADRSAEIPSEDPFLKSNSVVSAGRHPLPNAPGSEWEANVALTQHVDNGQLGVGRSVPLQDGSSIAKPFPVGKYSSSSASARPSTDFPFAGQQGRQNRGDQIKKAEQVFAGNRLVNSSGKDQKQLSSNSAPKIAHSNESFSTIDLGRWKTVGHSSAPKDSFKSFPLEETKQPVIAVSGQPVKHRKRMATLLEKAKIQQKRGELHSAYRSALLAKNIADQHQISLAANESDPGVFASEIAAKIWGTRSSEAAKSDVPPKSELPVIRPRRTRSQKHDQAFTKSSKRLDWKSFSAGSGQDAESHEPVLESSPAVSLRNSSDAPAVEVDTANETRQEQPVMEVQQLSTPVDHEAAQSLASDSQFVELALAQTQWQPQSQVSDELEAHDIQRQARPMPRTETSVTVAPFHSIAESHLAQRVDHQEEAISNTTSASSSASVVKSRVDDHSSLTAEEFQVDSHLEMPASIEVATKVAAEQGSEKEVSSQANTKWGVIAFILAVISTLIGLKMSGGETGKSVTVDEDGADGQSDDEQPALKISKAA